MSTIKTIATPDEINASALPAVQIADAFVLVPDETTGLIDIFSDHRDEDDDETGAPEWARVEADRTIEQSLRIIEASVTLDDESRAAVATSLKAIIDAVATQGAPTEVTREIDAHGKHYLIRAFCAPLAEPVGDCGYHYAVITGIPTHAPEGGKANTGNAMPTLDVVGQIGEPVERPLSADDLQQMVDEEAEALLSGDGNE